MESLPKLYTLIQDLPFKNLLKPSQCKLGDRDMIPLFQNSRIYHIKFVMNTPLTFVAKKRVILFPLIDVSWAIYVKTGQIL